MKELIKKVLNEHFELKEFTINRKSLLHDLQMMDFDFDDAQDELEYHIEWVKSLPKELKLYRVIYADSEEDINVKEPGKHYSMDKSNLTDSHSYVSGYGSNKYLLTVIANKSLVDPQSTISNNILYPNEKEITLKKNGKGAKVINIKELEY